MFANYSILTEVILPKNTEVIKYSAFQFCVSLEKIIIPVTVTKIDDTTFQCCYSLLTVCEKSETYAKIWAKEKEYMFEEIVN